MKNWSNKKILTVGLAIIAVCLAVSMIYISANRSTKREPTPQEIGLCAAYAVDWQKAGTGTDMEIILSLCAAPTEKTIGENTYTVYTSDTLGEYLYQFEEMLEIAQLGEDLYIQYSTPVGGMVTLGYSGQGLAEIAIYDGETDTMIHQLGGNIEVWEKFRTGYQWGRR